MDIEPEDNNRYITSEQAREILELKFMEDQSAAHHDEAGRHDSTNELLFDAVKANWVDKYREKLICQLGKAIVNLNRYPFDDNFLDEAQGAISWAFEEYQRSFRKLEDTEPIKKIQTTEDDNR